MKSFEKKSEVKIISSTARPPLARPLRRSLSSAAYCPRAIARAAVLEVLG